MTSTLSKCRVGAGSRTNTMPFVLQVLSSVREGPHLHLKGRVVSGAFFGPESVALRASDGREVPSFVDSHGMEHPEGWPVVPEHRQTIVVLTVASVDAGLEVVQIEGIGSVGISTNTVDALRLIEEPAFWVYQSVLHCQSEEEGDPGLAWFGIDAEAIDAWYVREIQAPSSAGRSLCFRIPLPGSRYIEMEIAGGVEPQDRIWIGDDTDRVLLGYHSGHFSLPTMRVEEVSWIASATDYSVANLLWLSTVYVDDTARIRALAERLVAGVPGCAPHKRSAMTEALLDNVLVGDVSWSQDARHGWINDGRYSQRNPASGLSILEIRDFDFLRGFFSECR